MKKYNKAVTIILIASAMGLLLYFGTVEYKPQLVFAKDANTYSLFSTKINKFMSNFSTLYENYIAGKSDSIREVIGQADLPGSQGSDMRCYKDRKGNVLRYSITFYGELGQTIENYYFIGKDQIYITVLDSEYSCMLNTVSNDILKYELRHYIVDGQTIYNFDQQGKKIQKIARSKVKDIYISKKDLDQIFIADKK